MAGEKFWRGACCDECGNNLCCVPCLLLACVNGHRSVCTDIKVLFADFVSCSLDDRDCNGEVLWIGCIDQCTVSDPSCKIENLGPLRTDIDRDALLAWEGNTRKLCSVIIKELHS